MFTKKNIMQGFHVLLVRVFVGHTFSKARESTPLTCKKRLGTRGVSATRSNERYTHASCFQQEYCPMVS